jgi:hypothetical protein
MKIRVHPDGVAALSVVKSFKWSDHNIMSKSPELIPEGSVTGWLVRVEVTALEVSLRIIGYPLVVEDNEPYKAEG